jgi:hypothetical protein
MAVVETAMYSMGESIVDDVMQHSIADVEKPPTFFSKS